MENGLKVYSSFIKQIKDLIYRRQYEAMKKVNAELIQLYWEIGEEIERQQREQGWGMSVVEILAKELQKEFPGVKGFSASNLWRMRSFYLEYSQKSNPQSIGVEKEGANLAPLVREIEGKTLPPLVAEISWSKICVITEKCKDKNEREFYIKMTKRYGWTKDVLINNIENKALKNILQIKPILMIPYRKSIAFRQNSQLRMNTILTLSKWVSNTARLNLKRVL